MPPEFLNDADLEILAVLWAHGALKPADIQSHLSYEIKNPALRWQLGELVRSGLVERHREGKAYLYAATKPRASVFGKLARQLKKTIFGGSGLAMVGELIDSGELSESELRELAQRLQAKPERKSRP